MTATTPLARFSLAELALEASGEAPDEPAGLATVAGAMAVGLGRPKPVTLPVNGPGTAEAEAAWPTRKPTDC